MRIPRFLPLLVVAMGCGGGLGSHEDVADAKIEVMEEFCVVIEGITDKASVDAAKPKVEKMKKRAEEINAAEKKLGEPSAAEKKAIEAKVEAATKKFEPRMRKAFERMQNDPAVMAAMQSLMAEMGPMGR